MIHCLITDDEPLAREGLAQYVADIDFLQLQGTAENPLEAMSIMESKPVDLLFLDIQMPKINGLDFIKSMGNPPLVIITTVPLALIGVVAVLWVTGNSINLMSLTGAIVLLHQFGHTLNIKFLF